MQWSDSYSIGIDAIDDQHQALIGGITFLEDSLLDPDSESRTRTLKTAIQGLNDYARMHFTVEETVMEILGYPGAQAHQRQHHAFFDYLADLEQRVATGNVDANEVITFLRDWLVRHIMHEDRAYADDFKQRLR